MACGRCLLFRRSIRIYFETVINTIQDSARQLENKTWPILMPSETYPILKYEPIQNVSLEQKYRMMITTNN